MPQIGRGQSFAAPTNARANASSRARRIVPTCHSERRSLRVKAGGNGVEEPLASRGRRRFGASCACGLRTAFARRKSERFFDFVPSHLRPQGTALRMTGFLDAAAVAALPGYLPCYECRRRLTCNCASDLASAAWTAADSSEPRSLRAIVSRARCTAASAAPSSMCSEESAMSVITFTEV